MKLRKVYPKERITTKSPILDAEIRLQKSKYYKCPHCSKRTLIRHSEVSPFAQIKTAPAFEAHVRKEFDKIGTVLKGRSTMDRQLDTYDFLCRGCSRPVRLLYEESEPYMAAKESAVVFYIVERAD